ncbi:MAG: 50S ribosomal protein L6 [Spirochaetales bacterium]|nr:50S ribosomal protein L6 [Spirochaetales bacterium]
MSRIGRIPVEVKKDNINVTIKDNKVTIESPKGKLTQDYDDMIEIKYEKPFIYVNRKNDSKRVRSMHGLYRNLINNMVTGVTDGFTKVLQIIGVGYKAEVKENDLVLSLGFAHPVVYTLPAGISCKVEANTKIFVSGIDKKQVGQVCAEVRAFRPPEPYKGKGIRYENEYVRKKVGKTGVK